MKPKSIILLSMLFCLFSICLSAQTLQAPVLEATELQDGSVYYVKNTGLNLQLATGADWGTRAVLKENGLLTTVRYNAGTNLYVLEFPGNNWTLYRSNNTGDAYMDRAYDNTWNIQLVDAENLVYTIQAPSTAGGYNANQYFGSTGQKENDNYILKYNRDKTLYANYIKWQFLNISLYEARQALYRALVHASTTGFDYSSYSDIYTTSTDPDEVMNAATELDNEVFIAITGAASPDNPADLTYYFLVNPNFDNNTAEGWTGAGIVNYHEVEFYQSTFNMYQEITGLPAGNYRLKAQGFERPKGNDGGAAYNAGTETIYARLYAKSEIFSEVSMLFNSLYKHTYSGDGTYNGYVNTMASAGRALGDGLYEMVLNDIVLAENDVLTIGAKSNFSQSSYWVLFDNFRLEYLGGAGGSWDAPVLEATEVQDGSVYYVKNTGLNLQLATGADWGTRAILKENGLATTVHFDAATSLYVLEFPGNDWTLYRSNDSGDAYMDRALNNTWNIQPVLGEDLTYTIQAPSTAGGYNVNQYFGSTGQKENDNYILKYNRDKTLYANYIKWQFFNISLYEARLALCQALVSASETTTLDLSSYTTVYETSKDPNEVRNAIKELNRAVLTEKTRDASPSNPVDLTEYLVNPNFDDNTAEGWTGPGTVNYHEVEFYERTFDMYQEVTGLLPGKYILKAQGFERPKGNDSGTAYKNGTETIYARLYANSEIFSEASVTFNSLYKHTYSGEGNLNGYVDNMASAETAFEDGLYEMALAEIMLGEDDTLTIGAKTNFSQSSYWVLFDNFRLEYVGLDTDEIIALAQQRITDAQELLDDKMQNIVRGNLTSAVSQMQGILAADSLDLTGFYQAYRRLIVTTAAAEVSILAYDNLQTAIDSARVVYGDGTGNEAAAFQNSINTAEGIANNLDAELDTIYDGTSDVYTAIFAYRLANATGTAPYATTNPNCVRGSTSILARLTSGFGWNIMERGFCWSTHPEPTVLDSRTTEYFSHNGNIYHIKNLEPSTVYYIRAYNLTKTYAVSYGDILKVITLPGGGVTYTLNTDITGIREGVTSAVEYFNDFTSIQGHHVTANYGSGTPTAEASYGGWMTFGPNPSYQRTGTVLHEMGHTIGVGTHWIWNGGSPLRAEYGTGDWLGDRANKVVQFFENSTTAKLTGDGVHMWPYGINGAHEDSGEPALYMANTAVYQGLAEDGLPPTGGFGVPAYTFESEDNIKYYIKIEDEGLGRNTMYLIENAQGNLVLEVMSGAASLANDKAAWYFKFNPQNCYYTIRNASTGKYFTYVNLGTNGITLVNKTNPAASENFQMMMSRVNSVIGSGEDELITRTFWIIRPEHRTDPPALSAQSNKSVTATNFNLSNDATTQRWYVLNADEVVLFDKVFLVTNEKEGMMSQLVIYAENQELHISNIIEPSDIVVYDISGRMQFSMSRVSGSCSRPLSEGVYFVSVSNKRVTETKKVVVR